MRYNIRDKAVKLFSAIVCCSLLISAFSSSALCVGDINEISQEEFYDELTIMLEGSNEYSSNIETSSVKDGETITESKISTNRIIVSTDSNQALSKNYGAVSRIEGYNNWHIFQYRTYEEASAACETFSNNSTINFAEFDELIEFNDTEVKPLDSKGYSPLSWGAEYTQSVTANEAIRSSEIELPEVVVAVIDTGVDSTHSFFNSIPENPRVLRGNRNNDNLAYKEHGTHVAGIIANNTLPNVKIKSYNFFYYQGKKIMGTYVSLATEINSAISDNVDVINMSLGGWSVLAKSDLIEEAIQTATENNIPVVVSAGNEFVDASLIFPANDPNVITVSAINEDGNPAPFSNYGSNVDIAAPGVNINSTLPSNTSNNNFGLMDGTSMAAPFVTSAVAMMKTLWPGLSIHELKERLTDATTIPQGWSRRYGTGILNFENIIKNDRLPYPTIELSKDGARIASNVPDAKIYYTIDGTFPTPKKASVYSSELIDTTNITMIRAIAYKEGCLPSYEIVKRMKFSVDSIVNYKCSAKLPYTPDSKIVRCYSLNPDIVTIDYYGNMSGVAVGKGKVMVCFENNQVATYNVSVEYAWWQWLIRIFLFGFLWY